MVSRREFLKGFRSNFPSYFLLTGACFSFSNALYFLPERVFLGIIDERKVECRLNRTYFPFTILAPDVRRIFVYHEDGRLEKAFVDCGDTGTIGDSQKDAYGALRGERWLDYYSDGSVYEDSVYRGKEDNRSVLGEADAAYKHLREEIGKRKQLVEQCSAGSDVPPFREKCF